MSERHISASPGETALIGEKLASRLMPGDVVLLKGDLGAGKTCLIKGICKGLLCGKDDVSSPTFAIVHEYRSGRLPVFHIDLYRLSQAREVESLGLEEYYEAGGVCLVEWPERLPGDLPARAWKVSLDFMGEAKRKVEVEEP